MSVLSHKGARRRAALAAFALPLLAGLLATATPAHASTAPAHTSSTAHAGAVSGTAGLSPQVAATVKGSGANARKQALAAYWTPARMKAAVLDSQLPAMQRAAASKPAAATAAPAKPQGAAVQVAPAAAKVAHASAVRPAYYSYYAGRTAGHCVTEAQTWAVNWWFVPNCYNDGSGGCTAPFGWWAAQQLWAPTEWNYSVGEYVSAFGYPVPGYTGVDLVEANDYTNDYGDGTVDMFNNLTPGSSGGPWLASFNGSYGYIDGHNDFRYPADPQYMWSPYYGNQVANLYGSVQNLVG
ncbi:MAG TPA: hypothetical protein VGM10_09685 [Actinocrinis sp.]